jgi:hypothetical protein
MNRAVLVAFAFTLALTGAAGEAATIQLAVGDPYFVGLIDDGIPCSEALELLYLGNLTSLAPGARGRSTPSSTRGAAFPFPPRMPT